MWSFTWLILPIVSLLVLGFATWRIVKAIKKHKANKVVPSSSSNKSKTKEQKKDKTKNKQQKKANKANKTKTQNQDNEQEQTVKPRHQDAQQVASTENDKKVKHGLPRFDINDANIVATDKEKFVRHQELFFKKNKTNEENEEFTNLNEHFAKTYGHIPNQILPADYTQKHSGCYCFNGKGSQNFKQYCEKTPYDKSQDNGDRMIVQVDCGEKRAKLTFCINPHNQEMLNAAMKDIDTTISTLSSAKPVVKVLNIIDGKYKVSAEKPYSEFCKPEQTKKATAKTPELSM